MVYPQRLRESSDVDTDDPATGACPSSCSVDVETQLAASEETARRLGEELSAMEEQQNALERRVAELELELAQVNSLAGQMQVLSVICEKENDSIWSDTERLVQDTSRRTLDKLLELYEGTISVDDRNAVAKSVVTQLSLTKAEKRGHVAISDAEKSTAQRRALHRALAVEHIYCARNSNYVSEFNIAAMAVAYAVSSSRLVVDILGRVGPGGSYTTLKQWMKANSGEPLSAPQGVLAVAFDNEQRLVKNYLTRHRGRVSVDIITNVVTCVLPESSDLNQREDFKICHWKTASNSVMQAALKVPDLTSSPEAKQLRDKYVADRLPYACGGRDKVDDLVNADDERTIRCPECNSVYPLLTRNCKNQVCEVTNIREAISARKSVVTEVYREARQIRREAIVTVRPQISDLSGTQVVGQLVRHVESEKESDSQSVRPADVHLMEPCFVNPASLKAVEELLRHIGRHAGIVRYGGKERQWLAVTCDGVPFYLVKKAICDAQRAAVKEHLKETGWVDTTKLLVKDLREVLRKAKLPATGSKCELLDRVHEAINRPVLEHALAEGLRCDGEFDWVIPTMGGLHQEFMLCRSFLDVNWDVAYKGFALSQGYHGDKQLMYIRSGKDHHKTFDDISRFVDGVVDELLVAYVRSDISVQASVDGFFKWIERIGEKNLTVRFLAEQCFHYALGIQMFRRGTRLNSERLALFGWHLCSPLIHCRNHPKYQMLDILAEVDRQSQPENLRFLLCRNFTVSK